MIILILSIALILRIVNLNQSFWLDEAISVVAANKFDYLGLIRDFTRFDFHPPLFYIILKFWGSTLGFGEIAIRLLPVIFGVLTVYVTYLIAKELKLKALVAALLMATSPLHIYYSQEVRMYPLVAFFVSLSFLIFFKLLKKSQTIYWILFSVSVVAFMALDYVPVFVLPAYWAIAVLTNAKKEFYIRLFIAFLPLAVIFVFWLPTLSHQILSGRELASELPLWKQIIGSPTFREMALVWVKFIVGRISFYNKFLYGLLILAVSSIFGYAFLSGLRIGRKQLALWLLIPLGLGFIFSFFVPAFSYFRFLYILPAFYLIITNGVGSRVMIGLLIATNLFCLFFYYTNRNNWREEWREAVGFVESKASSKDVALFEFNEPFASWQWYSKGKVEAVGAKNKNVENLVEGKNGVWYFEYLADISDPDKLLLKNLYALEYKEVNVYSFRGVGKITYLRRD